MRRPPPIWKAKQVVYSIPIKIEAEQVMKVLVIAVLLACWASAVEPQQPPIYKVRFTATDATKSTYDVFMNGLRSALTVDASSVQGIPVLPSTNDLKPNDLHRYVVVELFTNNKGKNNKNVSLVIDVTNVYILGYRPGDGAASYFFNTVPVAVQNLFFQGTTRTDLKFDGSYDTLQGKAGEDRDQIPLGFAELRQKIENLNHYTPKADIKKVASSLLVCLQMISEAARYKVIQQQIAALAPAVAGGADKSLKPDGLMKGYQTNWGQLSTAVQSAKPDGSFVKSVTVAHLTYSNVAAVRPVIAVLLKDSPTAYHAAALLDRFIDQALTQI
ncbi:hypothetical protein F3Y22_tig00007099pilonHSYRG00017 [Hibiscus syriacus]|uniref:rRNA N-glycosylase n=1 Tax=Hibiscus syriacus TaxID=106335 RepID=A0A6A3CF65_HIBSY|nr:ribosome-inactivating protein cucurmosin-like [Hibiscus syriacus]KAE8726311.1 hypothetical protein F3Y22_tig00007099pilonHSYRG00017 [Hibiscus syriacus]